MLNKAILLACFGKKGECLGRFRATIVISVLPSGAIFAVDNSTIIESFEGDFTVKALAYIGTSGIGRFVTSLEADTLTIVNEFDNSQAVADYDSTDSSGMNTYIFSSLSLFSNVEEGQECVFAVYA